MKLKQWQTGDIELYSKNKYKNPFLEVDVKAEFNGPDGRQIKLLGFWDGEKNWKARFVPTAIGTWDYKITSNTSDSGLTAEGTIECIPYDGDLDIYKHGFLKVGPQGRHQAYKRLHIHSRHRRKISRP